MEQQIEIKYVDTVKQSNEWDSIISSLDLSTFFHTSYWLNIIGKVYKLKSHHIILKYKDKNLLAMPLFTSKEAVHSPFIADYGGACINQNYSENTQLIKAGFNMLFKEIAKISKEKHAPVVYVRGRYDNKIQNDLLAEAGFKSIATYLTYVLSDFYDVENILSTFNTSSRRGVRRALREGVIIEPITSENSALEDYVRLHAITKRKHGSEPFSEQFFELLSTIPNENIDILIARYNDICIAGMIVFIHNNRIHIFDNCSDPDYLKLKPNNLLYHTIIEKAKRERMEVDFGRTSPDHKGLREFKEGWGGSEYSFATYRKIMSTLALGTLKLGMKSIKRRM